MARRFLLGVALLAILLSAPACGGGPPTSRPAVADPEGGAKPRLQGG